MKSFYKLVALQLSSYFAVIAFALASGVGNRSLWESFESTLSNALFWWGLYLQVLYSLNYPIAFLLLTWFLVLVFVPNHPIQGVPRATRWFVTAIRSLYTPLASMALFALTLNLGGSASGAVLGRYMVLESLVFMAVSLGAVSIVNYVYRAKLKAKTKK